MNQKIPPEKPKRRGFFSRREESKAKLLENLRNNSHLTDEERFNRYLEIDLRIPSSYTHLDLETEKALKRVTDQFSSWYDAMAVSHEFIRRKQQNLFLPPSFILMCSLPLLGFYVANRNVHGAYQYRLPSSMPGLSMVCKKASVMDWSSVVGTQFFHKIDWKDVGVSLYRPDSAFVLFSPKVQFEQQEKYIGCFETVREYPNTIDLVKIDEDAYASKETRSKNMLLNFLKGNLAKRVTNKLFQPIAQKLRKDRSLAKHSPAQVVSSQVDDFQIVPTIGHDQNSDLKRLHYPPRKLFSLRYFNRPSFITRPKKLFTVTQKRNTVKVPTKPFDPTKPADHLFRSKIDKKLYLTLTNPVASRDHHVLMPADEVVQLHQKIKTTNKNNLLSPIQNVLSANLVKSHYYWQTFFNSLDLIPSQMQSVTYPNKPKLSAKDQFLLDMKTWENDKNYLQKAFILPQIVDNREKLSKVLGAEALRITHRKNEKKKLKLDKKKPATRALKMIMSHQKPLFVGFNTNTNRRAKHALVASDRRATFDQNHDNPYKVDRDRDASQHLYMLQKNMEDRILQRYKRNNPGWWKEQEPNLIIPPLFHINQVKKQSPLGLPEKKDSRVNTTYNENQDPPSKIFVLSQAIQDNIQQSLNTNVAVRQSSRYLIYNSLFQFKHLLGRNLYNRRHTKIRPLKILPDYILNPKSNIIEVTDESTQLKSLKKLFLYNLLVEESELFNIFANFPYLKRYEVEKAHNLVYSNDQLTEFEKLDPDLKDFILPLQNINTVEKLYRKRWLFGRKKMQPINFPIEQIEPKQWSNWEKELKSQAVDEKELDKFGLKPSTQELTENGFLVGRIDLKNLEIFQRELEKREPCPIEEFKVLLDEHYKKVNLKLKENQAARLRYVRLQKTLQFLQKERELFDKALPKVFQDARDVVLNPPEVAVEQLAKVHRDDDDMEQKWEKSKKEEYQNYMRRLVKVLHNLAIMLPRQQNLQRGEEWMVKIFSRLTDEKGDFEKSFMELTKDPSDFLDVDVPLKPEAPEFFSGDLEEDLENAKTGKKTTKSSILSKVLTHQVREKLIEKFMDSYYFEQGRFLNKLDLSDHDYLLRDLDKASLLTWRKAKDWKELERDKALEFYAPMELLNLNKKPSDEAKIKPHPDKFDVEPLKREFRRYLIVNPFSILPEFQETFFTRLSRDIIEQNAYKEYFNWYKYFFLTNVHFIRPAFNLNELDHLLKPNQLKAYTDYFKATETPRWTEEELKKQPVNDENLKKMLKLHQTEAFHDYKQIKQNYVDQIEREFQQEAHEKVVNAENAYLNNLKTQRALLESEDSPFELEVKKKIDAAGDVVSLSEERYQDSFGPLSYVRPYERKLTRREKRQMRKKLRKIKAAQAREEKDRKNEEKQRKKEEQAEKRMLERLKTPEQKRLEKEQKREKQRLEKEKEREQQRLEKEKERENQRLEKEKQAHRKEVRKKAAKLKNEKFVDFSNFFDFNSPEHREFFVENYGEKALKAVDKQIKEKANADSILNELWAIDQEELFDDKLHLDTEAKIKLGAFVDKQEPPQRYDYSAMKDAGLTYLELFKENLVHYLTPKKLFDPVYFDRLVFDQPSRAARTSFEKDKQNANFTNSSKTKIEKPDLSEAYKGISKEFGWVKKTLFSEEKQDVTKTHLNQEIVNAFIRSQKKFLKSKSQKQNESNLKQKIRNRIIQGHSPYLKRTVSGYLNPDATFHDKLGELAGWDNVFEKVKRIYRLTQSRDTNLFSAAQLAFIQRWGRLSTINSPLYQLTSPSQMYHYECFGRLINRRTSAVLDFKQLNLHSILKAGNPYRSHLPRNYMGVTERRAGMPMVFGEMLDEDLEPAIKRKKRKKNEDFSLEPLLQKLVVNFDKKDFENKGGTEAYNPLAALRRTKQSPYEEKSIRRLKRKKEEEKAFARSKRAFQTYDNHFEYTEAINNFEDSDDNYFDSDVNVKNSTSSFALNNDHFYDSDDYNSDENFDSSSQEIKLEPAQEKLLQRERKREQKRLEKEQKRLEKEQKREQKRLEKEQKREQKRRQKTRELETKANPLFDRTNPNSSRIFNDVLRKYSKRAIQTHQWKPDYFTYQRHHCVLEQDERGKPFVANRRKRSPLTPYPELYAYKDRGLPTRVFTEESSQELIDAKALMNKVRHRWFDEQNFESPMKRMINHTAFDFEHWNRLKWVQAKNMRHDFYSNSDDSVYTSNVFPTYYTIISNVSLSSPAFWSFLIFLGYLATLANRLRKDYQRSVYLSITNFLARLDLTTIQSILKVNEAVVHCKGIEFNQIVGGQKLLYLFYPLILWNRNKYFSFGSLPVFEYNLLQTLASGSPGFVLNNDVFEFNILQPTQKEIEMSRQLEEARNYMAQIEQQNCLLIGPPGTGKTFLVKALAAESCIPVILPTRYKAVTQLTGVEHQMENPDEILRMHQVFELASVQKPCILFLDEIDSMGQDRQDVLVDTSGPFIGPDYLSKPSELVRRKAFGSWKNSDSISVESLNLDRLSQDYLTVANPSYSVEQLATQVDNQDVDFDILDTDSRVESEPGAKKVSAGAVAKLGQLLCLLDGANQRQILIIGATNRPETLDPALTRPGRLNRIFYLDLPPKQKRLDLLKFYSRSRVTGPVDWDYFAKKTVGLSPAHLKAAMNLSALKTAYEMIQQQQPGNQKVYHSESSIEYGIQGVMATNSFTQGFIKQTTKRLNQLTTPLFFDDVGQMDLWQHVSLGSPIRPIVLPETIRRVRNRNTLTKTQTQVWNKIPNHIPRVSFPTLYDNVTHLTFQSIRGAGIRTHERAKNGMSAEKRREGRLRFYKRNRLAWRTAYLLSDPKTINYSLLKNVTIDDHPFVNGFNDSPLLDKTSAEILTLFKEYVTRVFRVHILGSKLLLHTTYAVDNPLIFKTEYIYRKVNNTVVRSSGQFTRFCSPTPLYLALLKENPTLFMQPDHVETSLGKMFSNSLTLHRSIAYNANKALMVHLLTETYQQEHIYDIWNRFKYNANPDKYQRAFVKTVQENFVTRKQFENYLVALSAGKVGEHLMLFYREALPKYDPLKPRFGRYTYDVSEIGRQELRQMTWLLNIMIEKNLFYNPSVDLSKQLLTTESYTRATSKYDTSIVAVASNKELWTAFDKYTSTFATEADQNPIVNKFLSLVSKPKTTYWWEPDGLDLPSPGNFHSISSWRSLFTTKEPRRIQRMPTNLNYDTYRPNVLRTSSLLDSPFDAKFLPSSFVESVTRQNDNWNQSCFSGTERLARALLLDTFAKSFYILASHRELSDQLSYHLLRSGKIQANKLKQISDTFLEPAQRQRLAQIERDKAIDEQILSVQKKKPE